MKEIKAEKLKEILENHRKWLNNEDGGSRANLFEADLSRANLSEANLFGANLFEADLSEANLFGANLSEANLSVANLSGANLFEADLSEANLFGANLFEANLSGADLFGANLFEANLSGADLFEANLSEASGNMKEVKSIKIETYAIIYTDTVMQIGCERHDIEDWFKFDDNLILEMEGKKALTFWKKWKPILQQIIDVKVETNKTV